MEDRAKELEASLRDVLRVGTPSSGDLVTVWGHGSDTEVCQCEKCLRIREKLDVVRRAKEVLGETNS